MTRRGDRVAGNLHHPVGPLGMTLAGGDHHPGWLGFALLGLSLAGGLGAFGVPPLPLHAPWHYLGVMDPACGGTRAMVAAVRGNFALSWRYNPASLVLLAGAFAVVTRYLIGKVSGRWLTVQLPGRWVVAGLMTAGGWLELNQQAHAAFLR